jgi:hypothetical protein
VVVSTVLDLKIVVLLGDKRETEPISWRFLVIVENLIVMVVVVIRADGILSL